MSTHAEISEIDDVIFPTVMKTDVMGVPIKEDQEEETVVPIAGATLENIDNNEEEDVIVPLTSETDQVSTDIEKQTVEVVSEPKESFSALKEALIRLYGEDLTILKEGADGQEVQVKVNEIDNLDLETFSQIITAKEAADKEELLKDKISLEGTSEFTKSLIEIEKKGGNPTQLLQLKDSYLDPLASLDTDTSEGQEAALLLYFKAQGRPEEEANILIEGYKVKGLLEDKALLAKEAIENWVQQQVEDEKANLELQKQQREKKLKEYKSDLTKAIDTKYKLTESARKKLIKNAVEQDNEGKTQVIKSFGEMMRNPETAADLVFFLTDPEEFLKVKTSKAVLDSQIKTASAVRILRTATDTLDKGKQKEEEQIVPINILKS